MRTSMDMGKLFNILALLAVLSTIVFSVGCTRVGELQRERRTIERDGAELFADRCSVGDMKRTLPELVDWLWRGQELPLGAVLLSGTSIVPPPELTLRPGDRVAIAITGLGELRNPVELVDTAPRQRA